MVRLNNTQGQLSIISGTITIFKVFTLKQNYTQFLSLSYKAKFANVQELKT